jgi:two-component system, NarL family, response regulator LiaR
MSNTSKVRVLIADDHEIVRQSLKISLESFDEFEVVAMAQNGQMALTMCHHYQPDVILMDLAMPVMDGLKATQHILADYPQVKIVVLSSTIEDELIQDVLQAGATGFLSKTGSIDEVADAVRQAYQGQSYLDGQALKAIISSQPPAQMEYDLTRRQREILALMIQGFNNRQIAGQLFISVSTVKNHIVGIFNSLNVDSRSKAVSLAVQHKILEDRQPIDFKFNTSAE